MTTIDVRPATRADIPLLERQCWPGGEAEMGRRIDEQGTCSFIALDNGRPIAQLYLRTYEPGFRSGGMHDGAWWADLAGAEGALDIPAGRMGLLGCWHVGRIRDADGTEHPAPEYRGQGLGIRLLEAAAEWARSPASPYDILAAKAASTEEKSYLGWVGGLPVSLFVERGFIDLGEFDDPYMRDGVDEIPPEARVETPWRFNLAALHLR